MTKASNDKYIKISVLLHDIQYISTPMVPVASPLVQGTEIDTGGRAPFATSTCQIIVEALTVSAPSGLLGVKKSIQSQRYPENKTQLSCGVVGYEKS